MNVEELFSQVINSGRKNIGLESISVVSVQKVEDNYCIIDNDTEVRLNSIIDDLKSSFTIYPKIGSKITVARLDNQDELVIIQYSEIDRIVIKMDQQVFEMKDGKFRVLNENSNLKTILNDLFSTLENSIIQTPSGAGKFIEINKQKFKSLNKQIDKLLF
ncbi:hypothetical protein [Empedobacter brevis]|uniref:hypothetical protein n=1 Tax=Empedobacter brevis TaxID=247 RepID=UPI0039B0AE40